MATVRLEDSTKYYGETLGVRDLNFEVKNGEFLVILGPTGAGKTTILNLISGVIPPNQGRIYFDQKDVTEVSPRRRNVAFVFQDFILYPNMTVYENIALTLKSSLRDFSDQEIETRVNEVAATLSISSHLKKMPSQLSGGEMQRVGIARALVREPNIFLMDEPLSNLDAKIREELRAELKRLQERMGETFLYVTHDQAEALSMGNRLLILNQGQVVQIGNPMEIYNDPGTLFVARYLSQPEINILQGRVEDSELKFLEGEGSLSLGDKLAIQLNKSLPGKEVIAAIYPEDVDIQVKAKEGNGFLPAKVEMSRFMGADRVVDLRLGKIELKVVCLPGLKVNRGQEVGIKLNVRNLFFFHPETEGRIQVDYQD